MRRRLSPMAIVAATAVLVLVAAACSRGGDAGGEGAPEAEGGAGTTIDVTLTEFAISPEMIDAPVGEPLTFAVANDGSAAHTFAVETGEGIQETRLIQPGDSAMLELQALDAGTYTTICTVSGHEGAGMAGTLMVGEGGTAAGASAAAGATGAVVSVEEMLQGHESSTEAFPAKTEGHGNELLQPEVRDGVKVFELTATEVEWETAPGTTVSAMTFNGTIPGPEIRVEQGDKVRIVVRNEMTQPTTMHLHGLTVPNGMDGVPYITQDPILPGDFFTYEFEVVDPPGMYVYHSHFNSTEQVGKGMYGAFFVQPDRDDWGSLYGETVDVEYTMFVGDGPTGYVLNGKEFPATEPIVAKQGESVLIHLSNDGAQIHPMHLHGFHFEVVGQDGFVLAPANRYMADTLQIAPGQRFDLLVKADYPGVWAYHCHILPHVEGPHGMYGMVTALVVE